MQRLLETKMLIRSPPIKTPGGLMPEVVGKTIYRPHNTKVPACYHEAVDKNFCNGGTVQPIILWTAMCSCLPQANTGTGKSL